MSLLNDILKQEPNVSAEELKSRFENKYKEYQELVQSRKVSEQVLESPPGKAWYDPEEAEPETPFHTAIRLRRFDLVQPLLLLGSKEFSEFLTAPNAAGENYLEYAFRILNEKEIIESAR